MTNEEFTGHLLAALHGPKAAEIVGRVIEVATANGGGEALVAGISSLHKAMHEGEREALWTLACLAIAEHLPNRDEPGMMRRIMRETEVKTALVERLRVFVKGPMVASKDTEATRRVAEVLKIDLEVFESAK